MIFDPVVVVDTTVDNSAFGRPRKSPPRSPSLNWRGSAVEPETPRTQHQWTDHGTPRNADLTELEWWFQSFALLRNKIAHGGEIRSEEYLFDDGAPHHWHAEWILRKAIKQTVANAGHDEVLLNAYERAFRRALPVLEEALQEPEEGDVGEIGDDSRGNNGNA